MVKQGLAEVIDSIKEESHDSVILVEGKRDKEALRKAGISDYAILQVSYKDENKIYNEVLLYHRNKVIALYDNDRTGEQKMSNPLISSIFFSFFSTENSTFLSLRNFRRDGRSFLLSLSE